MAGMEFNNIILHGGKPGERQNKILQKLQTREILATRYVDEDCLYTLGTYDSVFHMLDNLGLHDISASKAPTYDRLNRGFLSSLIYTVYPGTASTVGTVYFRMFNVEYEYTTDALAGLLGMPYGEGAICETPLDAEWALEAFTFWNRLSNVAVTSFEGILASNIHNPTIRIFRYLLACTIFGRENSNKVNARELLFLEGCLTNRRINHVPFMLAHMSAILKKGGTISFGGLITSIARALNLHAELATFEPLAHRTINLMFLKDMKLCKVR
jgi:hypothetical protein